MSTVIMIDKQLVVVILDDESQVSTAHARLPKSFSSELEFAQWMNEFQPDGHWGWVDAGHLVSDVDCIAIGTQRPVHRDQMESLARYFLEGPFAGEYYGLECLDEADGWGRLFILSTDSTKCRHDDMGDALSDLWSHFQEGSPVRKTDRAGLGTRGTRAVEGVKCDLWVAFR